MTVWCVFCWVFFWGGGGGSFVGGGGLYAENLGGQNSSEFLSIPQELAKAGVLLVY